MTLTIENGTNVANANSYITLAEVRAFASARGITLSIVDATLESQIIKAMDWVESKRDQFKGSKTYTTQSLQWPRFNVYIDNLAFSSTSIPIELKNTLCQLVIEIHNGVDIYPNFTGNFIKREKVDVIETEYSERNGNMLPTMSKIDDLLRPLLSCSFGNIIVSRG